MPSVTFRKSVSDGNYGSESAEVVLDLPEGIEEDVVVETLATARRMVHYELSQSPSYAVKHALEYRKPIEDRDERWQRAEESAELELAIGRREIEDED